MPSIDTSIPVPDIDAPGRAAKAELLQPAGPLSAARLFWTIFWALWAFSLSAAVVVALLRMILLITEPVGPVSP